MNRSPLPTYLVAKRREVFPRTYRTRFIMSSLRTCCTTSWRLSGLTKVLGHEILPSSQEDDPMLDLTGHAETLRRLTRTDHDPRVRHRADALLALARGRSVEETAQAMGCCTKRIRV